MYTATTLRWWCIWYTVLNALQKPTSRIHLKLTIKKNVHCFECLNTKYRPTGSKREIYQFHLDILSWHLFLLVMVPYRNTIVIQLNSTPWPNNSLAFRLSLRRDQQSPMHRKGLICHNGLKDLYNILLLLGMNQVFAVWLQCTSSVDAVYL